MLDGRGTVLPSMDAGVVMVRMLLLVSYGL